MSALSIQPTFPIFTDADGSPLENGYIWIGTANLPAQTSPITAYWDAALTITATQPIRTLGGYPSRSGSPARLYVNSDYSILVQNKNGSMVYSSLSATERYSGVVVDITFADIPGSLGSDRVSFLPDGIDAVSTTAQAKLREIVSVKDFGAVGDGSTNDAPAIIKALTHAVTVGACKVVFPTATYKCGSILGSYTGSDIELDLQSSTLDFSSLSTASTGPLLAFAGVYSSAVSLTSNANAGDKSVAASSSAFAAGDMVRLYSNAIWDSTRTSTRVGEINFVEAIPSASAIDLTMELQGGYTTANAGEIQKLIPIQNIVLRNGTIIGPSGNDQLIGVQITLGKACLIENMKSYDVDKIHFRLIDCVYSKVTNCHIEQSNHSAQAYGISFVDCTQDCTAVNNSFNDVRHSLSTNNQVSTSYGITRRILFANNVVTDSAKATGGSGGDAIDTHAGAEEIYILGNTVNSSSGHGVNFEARTGAVSNNYIKNTATAGIYINPRADSTSSITVASNTLLNIGDSASEYGVVVLAQTANMVNCVVTGNRAVSYAQPIRVVGIAPYNVSRVAITGNTVQKMSAATTLNGIEVGRCNYASVSGNSVLAGAVGIELEDCNNSTVTGNCAEIVNTSGSVGYGVRLQGTGTRNVVSSNSVRYSTSGLSATIGISFAPTTITYSGAWNNVTDGFGTNVNTGGGTGNVSANNI